jgi:putative zinc finger protein
MFDCANVEMRELLPELAAGTLDDATRARVERHVGSCAECASELETLRLVRSAYAVTPTVDVRRIVAALRNAVPLPQGAHKGPPVKRWVDWRVAAALTMISVGGLSLALAHRRSTETPPRDSTVAVPSVDTSSVQPGKPAVVGSPPGHDTTRRIDRSGRTPSTSSTKAQLAFAGGMDDMDDGSIKALLGALDEMDRAPVAPSEEPDPTPVLPVIKTGQP